jgi:hypothetical protein
MYSLFSLILSTIRQIEDRMGKACSTYREEEKCINNFGRKNPNRKVGAPGSTLEDNIKMDPKGRVWERAEWSDLAQGTVEQRAVLNTVMNIQLPPNAENTLTIPGTIYCP